MKKRNKTQAGFTLLEIMVVVVIIGILASLVAPSLLGNVDTAKQKTTAGNISSLENALERYRLNHGGYPTTDQGLEALVSKPRGNPEPRNYPEEGYLKRLPKDAWGNDFQYLSPGDHGKVDVFSFGADGQEGGEGLNADIGNWNIQDFQ
ncbi:type II secretion system major pseudopilin GspG [Vibrio diazotrophicus]|uniref:type II secretion system major pseudopilin GspG n=1 Tax=Vibrio diazotrophicus TaxID=685 RepID=UPI003D2F8B01